MAATSKRKAARTYLRCSPLSALCALDALYVINAFFCQPLGPAIVVFFLSFPFLSFPFLSSPFFPFIMAWLVLLCSGEATLL